jgi:long-chain fatty acid transport protein
MPRIRAFVVVACALGLAAPAWAGGLYLNEFGTSSMGVAGAGAEARAEDASTSWHNPAGMSRLDDHHLMSGMAPGFTQIEFDPDSDTPRGGSDGGDQGGFVPVMSAHYVHRLTDRVSFGASLFSMSGAALDPGSNWAGRNDVTEISLLTLTALGTASLRLTDWLYVGGGAGATYGTLDFDLKAPILNEPKIRIDNADDFAPTVMAGVLIVPLDNLRIGATYVSPTELDLEGDRKLPIGASASLGLEMDLAQMVHAGVVWDATDRLRLLLSAGWEDWSALKDVPVSAELGSAALPTGWYDTWKLGGGVEYRLLDDWLVQLGVMYDSSPVDTSDRIASLPVDEQLRVAGGVVHDLNEALELGFSFVWADLGKARLDNAFVKGNYRPNQMFLFGVTLNWKKLFWSGRGRL